MSMSLNNSPLTLPVITIDPTFPSVIQDVDSGIVPSDQFWISCYKKSQPSVHAKILVELDEVDRNLVLLKPRDGDVEIVKVGDKGKVRSETICSFLNVLNHRSRTYTLTFQNYTVACGTLGIPPTKIILPTQEYRDAERSNAQKARILSLSTFPCHTDGVKNCQPQRITAFDIAPDGSKFATGFLDGSVFLYPASPAPESPVLVKHTITDERAISRPHLSTVTHLQFFPSSRVLLSAGADFSLNILPADLPSTPTPGGTRVTPARTLRGHARTITSTAIIALGRNILSSSLDSMVKLWDVPSSSTITSFAAHSPVLSTSLGDRVPATALGEEPTAPTPDTREIPEVSSKVVFSGLQNGAVEQFDLRLKKSVYKSPSGASGLSSIVYSSERNLLATGSAAGVVTLYDTRALGTPITEFQRNEAGIEDLVFTVGGSLGSNVGLAIATTDGLPYIASIIPEGVVVGAELAGGDCDPVRNVRVGKVVDGRTEVWSAGDDAVVRRYLI
jgi:proteasomal ATPase-associated factor 1